MPRRSIHRKFIYIKVANIATFFRKSCGFRNSVSLLVNFLAKSCGFRNFFLKIFLFFRKKHYNFVSTIQVQKYRCDVDLKKKPIFNIYLLFKLQKNEDTN
jgi:hypothetical protein